MKKLVTAAEVEASIAGGQKVLYIDDNTIVTPAARDAAREAGIEIAIGTPQPETAGTSNGEVNAPKSACNSPEGSASPAATGNANVDLDVVYKVLSILKDKGLLNGVSPEYCPPVKGPVKPYSYQQDPSGIKIVDGATILYDPLKTDDPANQVSYQEIVNADDGCRMNAGMISIDNCRFGWKTESQEIYHVVEGTLSVTAGNKEYKAYPGDTVFFPEGVQVTFGSPDRMKAFYAAY
jgi:ethanolamine utilization protein EutQ